jgi:hypothetical protein
MYIFEEMIDLGLEEGETWTSDDHRVVAQNILLCNPLINQRDLLCEGVAIINSIPQDQIRLVTAKDLKDMGCPGIV